MEWIDGVKLTDEKGTGHCVLERGSVCWRGGLCVGEGYGGCALGNAVMRARRDWQSCVDTVAMCGIHTCFARRCSPPRPTLPMPRPAAMSALGLDIVDFVTVGIECTLRQLLEAGFFHAGALGMIRVCS